MRSCVRMLGQQIGDPRRRGKNRKVYTRGVTKRLCKMSSLHRASLPASNTSDEDDYDYDEGELEAIELEAEDLDEDEEEDEEEYRVSLVEERESKEEKRELKEKEEKRVEKKKEEEQKEVGNGCVMSWSEVTNLFSQWFVAMWAECALHSIRFDYNPLFRFSNVDNVWSKNFHTYQVDVSPSLFSFLLASLLSL